MTHLQKHSVATLLAGLVLAAFVVPWTFSKIGQTVESIKQYQRMTAEAAALPAVDPQAMIARQVEQVRRAAEKKAAEEQATRIAAALNTVAIPGPKKPVVKPTPSPAYSIVPQGSPQLIPLEGWVDQPDKKLPGRVRTELMVRNVRPSVRPHVVPRAPCLKPVSRPAERIARPYGWLAVPARTVMVPCGS